ncbi:MAG: class I SAM-dependent methyltransferase [Candidatus Woesearchaeota archaeon]
MKYRLMDVMSCPSCGNFPLVLSIKKENKNAYSLSPSKLYCEKYCEFNQRNITLKDTLKSLKCTQCFKREVIDGELSCSKCHRLFSIKENIPVLLDFFESNTNINKKDSVLKVQNFWNLHPCFGKWASAQEQFEVTEEYRYKSHPWLKKLVPFTGLKNQRMLEVGCSQCIDLSQFTKHGTYTIGMDLTPEGIFLGKRRLEYLSLYQNADLIIANVEKIPFRADSFEYVYSYGVIHHTKRTQRAIDNIYTVLKPKGEFNIMYYYTYSFTKVIEATAKALNNFLVFVTRDKDIFWRITTLFPVGKKQRDVTAYRNTRISATLHAPIIKSYSKRQSRRMFGKFKEVKFNLTHLHPIVQSITGRGRLGLFLERHWGWDLMIGGKK